MAGLDEYAFSGHAVLVGKRNNEWQEADYVYACFDAVKRGEKIARENGYALSVKKDL